MKLNSRRRRGNATIEMTLVGIPMIFVLISVFEMARGMWMYHTLAYAIKEGTRYAIVHGKNCDPSVNKANNCLVSVAQIAQVIQNAGVGLDPTLLKVEMQSSNAADDTGLVTLSTLLTQTGTTFPTDPGNLKQNPITITAEYPFQSAISMFWPGAGKGIQFKLFNLPASSQEMVQF